MEGTVGNDPRIALQAETAPSNVTLEFDRMSSMKYSIIDNLIEQSNTRVIKNDIENTDGAFSGSLVLEIGSD